MWRILLSSYNLIQLIYEELSHSQGPPRCCLFESLKIDISDVETPQPNQDLNAEISHGKLYTIQSMQFSTCMMSIGAFLH